MFKGWKSGRRVMLFAALVLTVSACATAPLGEMDPDDPNDPAESLNRSIFTFNRALDTLLFRPAAELYHALMPPPAQTAIHSALNNLRSPMILVHDLLQGEGERAGQTVARFAINSTVGLGGLNDQAADWGFPFHDEDFGQTLAVWGVNEGPFVMLPVFGPSNPRDAVGMAADMFLDPLNLLAAKAGHGDAVLARTAVSALDIRTQHLDTLDQMEKTSVDFYAALRSAYRQRRASDIRNGEPSDILPLGPALDSEPPSTPKPAPVPSAPPPQPRSEAPAVPAPAIAQPVQPVQPSAAAKPALLPKLAVPARPPETLVHLGSYSSFETALADWEAHLARFGDTLSGAEPSFSEVQVGSQTFVRLGAAFASADAGQSACGAMTAAAAFCQVVPN